MLDLKKKTRRGEAQSRSYLRAVKYITIKVGYAIVFRLDAPLASQDAARYRNMLIGYFKNNRSGEERVQNNGQQHRCGEAGHVL